MAIRSCKPEQGKLLNNRKRMEMVKESLNEGYCDVAGQVGQLEHLGKLGAHRTSSCGTHDMTRGNGRRQSFCDER
jgi:hypothetical protein